MVDNGRIKGEKVTIQDNDIKDFFSDRAKHYLQKSNNDNPFERYSVTMFQDDNPELVKYRDNYEKEKIGKLLEFDKASTILDIGCGVGRWADFFVKNGVKKYYGIDYSEEIVEIAKKTFSEFSYEFYPGAFQSATNVLEENGCPTSYDFILVNGVLSYINDNDLDVCFSQLCNLSKKGCYIYLKESAGIDSRLTLKDYNSKELKTEYNAIYRSKDELESYLKRYFPNDEYNIISSGYLYPEELRNRSETAAFYWIIKKKD